MEQLEAMMQRVLDEVEMLKRIKQGARRKKNGEMFKGDARNRLNPPEHAILYMHELRGDTANRESGESEEERMARIEREAQDFEEVERTKRAMMQTAIATETNIIRETSRDVRLAQQSTPTLEEAEGIEYSAQDFGYGVTENGRRLAPLDVGHGQPQPWIDRTDHSSQPPTLLDRIAK